MGGVNGTPQPDRHRKLGGKKKAVPPAAAGGSAGGGCGTHAMLGDPTTWTAAQAMIGGLTIAAVIAVVTWVGIAAVAWRARGRQ